MVKSIQTKSIIWRSYASEVPSDPKWEENFIISNLPVGRYRITTYIDNQFVEKYIDINNNSLTDISLVRETKNGF